MTDPGARPSEQKAKSLAGWIQIICVLVVIASALLINRIMSSGSVIVQPSAETVSELLQVETLLPVPETYKIIVTERGVVTPRNTIAIAPLVSGRVTYVSPSFKSGKTFAAGEQLFKIDPQDYQLELERAAADMQTATSALQVEQAESALAIREWNLLNPGEAVPDLVARLPQIAQSKAAVDSAEARLNRATVDLSRTRFSLPFAGTVQSSRIEVGQQVLSAQSYGEVFARNALEVSVRLDTEQIAEIAPPVGRKVTVSGVINGRAASVTGQIARQLPNLDARTRQTEVLIEFDEPSDFLSESFVTVVIEGDTVTEVYRLPSAALAQNETIWIVSDGQLLARTPEILDLNDDFIITRPFEFADGVVITPLNSVVEGTPVETNKNRGSRALESTRAENTDG